MPFPLGIKTIADSLRCVGIVIVGVVFISPSVENPSDSSEFFRFWIDQKGRPVVANPNVVGGDGMYVDIFDSSERFGCELKRLAGTTQDVDRFDFGECTDDFFRDRQNRLESAWPSRFAVGPSDPGRFVPFPLGEPGVTAFDGAGIFHESTQRLVMSP